MRYRLFLQRIAVFFLLQQAESKSTRSIWTATFENQDRLRTVERNRRDAFAPPQMQLLHMTSVITARFANVNIESTFINKELVAQEVLFQAQLPKTAFVSNFSMSIDGETYVGIVKETEVAEAEYRAAKTGGATAGLVKSSGRETQWFEVSVNIESTSDVTFSLQYQELLTRKLSVYEHVIYADIRDEVEEFKLDVYITEPTGIKSIEAAIPYKGSSANADKDGNFNVEIRKSKVQAQISYRVNPIHFARDNTNSRRFVVRYDAERGAGNGGDLQVYGNCFAHFFAPNLPSMPKRIVFVIDVSGSMMGKKIEQTKAAFHSILTDVRSFDKFNIVTFSGEITKWHRQGLRSMSEENARTKGKHFVSGLNAAGSTNLYASLITALKILDDEPGEDELGEPLATDMIIVLTDGNPTAGLSDKDEIVYETKKHNKHNVPIYCLGFGGDVSHEFLKKLAEENHGKSRRIYLDSDSDLQLKGFYDEVSTPLLSGITVAPLTDSGIVMTRHNFKKYFNGSELVVLGKRQPGLDGDFDVVVNGRGRMGDFEETVSGNVVNAGFSYPVAEGIEGDMETFCERMWAYLTINQLTTKMSLIPDPVQKQTYKDEIIRLALKFNFVTSLTSMIARKPGNQSETAVVEEREPRKEHAEALPPIQLSRTAKYRGQINQRIMNSFRKPYTPPVFPMGYRPSYSRFGGSNHHSRASTRHRKFFQSMHWTKTIGAPRTHRLLKQTFGHRGMNHFSVSTTTVATTTTTTTRPTTVPITTAPTTVPTTTVTYPPLRELDIVPNCGRDILLDRSQNRTLTSPNYPSIYPRNAVCKWQLGSDSPFSLRLSRFDLEEGDCTRDRLMIYQDLRQDPRVLCGFKKERILRARAYMAIIFISNEAVQGRGFQAELSVD